MRNIKKLLDGVKVNNRYDLDLRELDEIMELSIAEAGDPTRCQFALLSNAFKVGYAIGQRAARAEDKQKKERKEG